ncbi:MAG TPA: ATP-dependent DNA helicase RecG [Myxococcales bacterium]|nr:ATP-dependent DNA helicase RecG [Myxococcales bacterium]
MSHPLDSLVAPLRYACQRNFAQLGTVKNLRGLLERAVETARQGGIASEHVAGLSAELDHVDSTGADERKGALSRIIGTLRAAGVSLPQELDGISPAPAPARAKRTPARGASAAVLASAPEPGDAPPAPAKRTRARATPPGPREAPGSGSEAARLLSIAPRSGPLATPLKNVGFRLNPRLISILNRKGLRKVGDVLFMLPRCYEDRRRIHSIAELRPGERGVAVGVVKMAGEVRARSGRRCFRAVIGDASGSLAVTYFRSGPWLASRFPLGKRMVISGEVRATLAGREMAHPEVEPAEDLDSDTIHFRRVVPIYPGFERHEQRAFRELTYRVAEKYASSIEEPLPDALREKLGLLPLAEALRRIHFPREEDSLEQLDRHQGPAHRRLAFDELFFLQLGMAVRRRGVKVEPGVAFDVSDERLERARSVLPFQLTSAQSRVMKEIARDMGRSEPMHRLLQGDVGSGKTAVAMVSAMLALQDGYQVAVMAPTEILAEQHHRTFARYLRPAGFEVGLIKGGGGARERQQARDALASGQVRLAVGTHALIEEGVEFQRLGLVVIDEQHRFGVIQRHALMRKGVRPDVLVMTATPIPRTLAMCSYGDLDQSLIDELPPGRTPVVTRVFGEKQRPRVHDAIRAELEQGRQCYVVYPLVEESEKVDLQDATRGAETLRADFSGHSVGLLHGRMSAQEKDAVMEDFRARRIQLLVCTTVVEVGVDVPNASVMVIEAAERFGLSQLHQLRGRVGRGAAKSFCYLVAGYARSREATDRLRVMEEHGDGFVIAEKDLDLRGPGEFLGTRQSGVPELAVANLARDADLIGVAQVEARAVVDADPRLDRPEHRTLVRALEERWEGRLSLARVG